MSELGERVVIALADQGFGIVFPTEATMNLLTPDGRRVHNIPAEYFYGDDQLSLTALRIVVAGLEHLEGFVPPEGFWDS